MSHTYIQVYLIMLGTYGIDISRYTYESTTLAKLLQLVGSKLKGRIALSMAFLMHGEPGCFKICPQKVHIACSFVSIVMSVCFVAIVI